MHDSDRPGEQAPPKQPEEAFRLSLFEMDRGEAIVRKLLDPLHQHRRHGALGGVGALPQN